MRFLTFNTIRVLALSVLSVVAISACSYMGNPNPPVRVYHLDGSCNYYYTDNLGKPVYDGKYTNTIFAGQTLKKDCDGRWYYGDSMGNKVYVSKYCSTRFMHKWHGSCHR